MDSCSKIPHSSLTLACLALRAIQRRSAVRGRTSPTGAYFCGPCRRWHLTSTSPTRMPQWLRPTSSEQHVCTSARAAGALRLAAAWQQASCGS